MTRFAPTGLAFVLLSLAIPAQAGPRCEGTAALEEALGAQSQTLSRRVLRDALNAYTKAACSGIAKRAVLGVIDYSLSSLQPRLWIFDIAQRKLLFHDRVAHGKNSGEEFTTRFSNRASSLMSSLGVFTTGTTYVGKHGLSLRLHGREAGFNDHAHERAVVFHGAAYLEERFISENGRVGRSWGCPAVARDKAGPIIRAIQGGAVLVSWFPDKQWLRTSAFLASPQTPAPQLAWPNVPVTFGGERTLP